jgi:hypothetical protein
VLTSLTLCHTLQRNQIHAFVRVVHFTIYETHLTNARLYHVEKLTRMICVARLALDDCLSYSDTNNRRMFSEARLQLSYALSEFLQATDCILELTRIRQSHSTCRSHIFTFTYKDAYG